MAEVTAVSEANPVSNPQVTKNDKKKSKKTQNASSDSGYPLEV